MKAPAIWIGGVLIGLLAAQGCRASGEAPAAACNSSSAGPEEVQAAAQLEHDPTSTGTRVKLANALSDRGCYSDAIRILEAGLTLDPHDRILRERLRSARSTLSEEGYFEGLGRAEETAKVQHDLIRCRSLGDLTACDQALATSPGDPTLLVAKADALMHANRPVEALPLYEKASSLEPSDETLKSKVNAAETARLALVARCLNESGDAGLAACDLGLRHGARDEFSIYQRKGVLLQAQDQPARALDAYIAASLIDPSDRSVALAIVALTQSTGRQDALALTARASALRALGRTEETVANSRQAESIAGAGAGAGAMAVAVHTRSAKAPVTVATAARVPSAPTVATVAYSNAAPVGQSH